MDETVKELLNKTQTGFGTLKVDDKYKKQAINLLEIWLIGNEFTGYKPQIEHLINSGSWDYLLDCFYQIIPFGTGGRRGEVGIGPNRINKWTIQASAQGHSQYLLAKYKEEANTRGVVLSYGIREFFGNKYFNPDLENPVMNLKGIELAYAAAEVYTGNGIKTYIFESARTTPELSFAVRFLKAVAGDMFDASHNPPEHNGKKVYDDTGGQLIPPHDEHLVKEVTENVKEIKKMAIGVAKVRGLIEIIGKEVDQAYVSEVTKLTLSPDRSVAIVYTPLHGVGTTSVGKTLESLGFNLVLDPKTKNQSGRFENITFNIPNPEVRESFDTTLVFAKEQNADIILNSDPDADRIGLMVNHQGDWHYLNGNEIGSILCRYVIEKKRNLKGKGVVIKTSVTTNLAQQICDSNGIKIMGELLVGFKYIGDIMNQLEGKGEIGNFLIGLEESHGYIAGNYLRDKDAAIGALWLAELASELKGRGETLVDYLNDTYAKYGYFSNYLTEIRLPGAEGMSLIHKIQKNLRENKPSKFGVFEVSRIEDFQDRTPILSQTDLVSKDSLTFHFETFDNYTSFKISVRPSGTEPKIKMYFEIGNKAASPEMLDNIKQMTKKTLEELEKAFMSYCYRVIEIDFPERGFLLFWQLPLSDKLKYFEIEPEIEKLKEEADTAKRKQRLFELVEFLGSNPLEKVNKAFKRKNEKDIQDYLAL